MAEAFRTLSVILTANTTQFTGAFIKAGDQVTAFAIGSDTAAAKAKVASTTLNGMSKSADDVAKSFLTAKTVVAGFGTAAVLGLGVATKQAIDFQTEMTKLITQANVSPQDLAFFGGMKGLESQVLSLSAAVGIGPTSLAEGLYHVASAGIPAANQLKTLQVSAELARISGSNLEDTTNAVIGVMNGFKNQNISAAEAAGLLNATVGAGNIRMQQLATSIGKGVLPVFETAGLTMKDFGAVMATLGDNATDPVTAATRLITTIQKMVPTGNQAIAAFKELGLTQNQLGDDMRKPNGLLTSIGDIQKGYNALAASKGPVEAGRAIAESFGGSKGSTYIIELMQNYALLQQKYGNANFSNPVQSLAQAWKTTQTTVSQAIHEIEAGAEELGTRVGLAVLPTISNVIKEFETLGSSNQVQSFMHGLGNDLGVVVHELGDVGKLVVDVGHDIGPVAGGFAELTAKSVAEGLRGVADVLGPIARFLDQDRIFVDALALAWGGRYVLATGEALVTTLALAAAQAGMATSSALSAVKLGAASQAAEGAALRFAGIADATAGAEAGLAGMAGLMNPLVVGVAVLGAAYVSYNAKQQATKKLTDDLTSAFQKEADGVSGASSAVLTAQLAHHKYQQELRELNVDESKFIDAIKGNSSAQADLKKQFEDSVPALRDNKKLQDELSQALNGNDKAAQDLFSTLLSGHGESAQSLAILLGKYGDLASATGTAQRNVKDQTSAINELGATSLAGSGDAGVLANAIKQVGDNSDIAKSQLQALDAQNKVIASTFQDIASPKVALQQAIQDNQSALSQQTRTSREQLQEQKKQQDQQIEDQIKGAQERKKNISNSSAASSSAINDEIDGYRRQKKAQDDTIASQIKNAKTSADLQKQQATDTQASVDQVLTILQSKDKDLEAYQQNLVAVARKFGQPIADAIVQLGPDAAHALDQLANTNNPSNKKFVDELARNSGLTDFSNNIEGYLALAATSAGKGTNAIGAAALAGLKDHSEEIQAQAKKYQIDLSHVADPVLAQLGLSSLASGPGQAPSLKQQASDIVGTLKAIAGALSSSGGGASVATPTFTKHADGGIENHVAQIAGNSHVRMWAEPETGGEAYIPLAHSKSERSKDIWAQVGRMKGWAFADGGVFGLPAPPQFENSVMGAQGQSIANGMYLATQNMMISAFLTAAAASGGSSNPQGGGYGGAATAAPKGQVVDWIHQAEAIAGWPDSYTNGLYQLIMHESGGNPTIVNTWDSNAKAGHPSIGMMQTIQPTFDSYKFPGHNDIRNPVDNILAGTAYALRNYGPSMVTAGGRHDAKGNYIGYADGGIYKGTYDRGGPLMPGYTMAYNGTGKPEHILTEKMVEQIIGAVKQSRGGNQINVIADAKSVAETARVVGRKLR